MQENDFLQLLSALKIGDNQIEKIALNTVFLIRKKLVAPADMLYAICCQSIQGTVSFNDVAAKIDAGSAVSVSRQAIAKKMNKPSCMDFLKKILALVILSKIDKNEIDSLRQGNKFTVFYCRSTIIGLPVRLFELFSGVSNAQVSVCNARIQCVYDLINKKLYLFYY